MRFRKLRIASSAVCGIACLLLFALSMRSYWIIDAIGRGSRTSSETTLVAIFSEQGTLIFERKTAPTRTNPFRGLTEYWSHHTMKPKNEIGNFMWINNSGEFLIQFPTWLPGIFLAAAAWIPWIGLKWKFGLRTLLIATTLVAMVLGLAVYALRK